MIAEQTAKDREKPAKVKKPTPIDKALKQAIYRSKKSCYRISQDTGVTQATLSRFLRNEQDISLSIAAKLAQYLGLTLL